MSVSTPHGTRTSAAADPARVARHARQRRRRGSIALCALAAFALNAVALGVFADVATRWQRPWVGTREPAWITAIEIAPPSEQRAEPVVRPAGVEPAAPPRTAVARQRAPTATAPDVAVAPPDDADKLPTHFYAFNEVERAAEPDSDWNLDPSALDAAGIEKLVFEIFVDRAGAVVGCVVLEPSGLNDEVRGSLEQRLRSTTLQPAIRGGVNVPSVRRIEVSVVAPAG